MRTLACVCLLILGVILPASAAAPASGTQTGRLPGGGAYIVEIQPSVPVAAVELWYRAPSVGFARDPIPGLGLLAAKSVAASIPVTGTALGRLVTDMGGRLAISSYPDSIEISALVPATRAADVVRAMTAAYFSPVLTAAGLRTARRDMAQESLVRSFESDEVLRDALFGQLFTSGPAHYSLYGDPDQVGKIALDTIQDFAVRAFRAKNAILVVSGAVDGTIASRAVPGRPVAPHDSGERSMTNQLTAAPSTVSRDFADPAFGYAFAGPAISDERAATAMDFIADYLFRPQTGVVSRAVASSALEVSGQFVTYHDPGVMLVEVSGSGDLQAARTEVDAALAAIRKPLDAKAFDAARSAFVYHLLSDLQTPVELADNFGWYTVEGDPGYAPGIAGARGRYFSAARGLTAQYVASVAAKYLTAPGATVTFVPTPKAQATEEPSK